MVEDVTDYGAAGDGSTDDTEAIIAAADAAGSGGTVYFPAGTYLIGVESRLPIDYPGDGSWDEITWKGENVSTTTIKMADGQSDFYVGWRFENGTVSGSTWEQLTIDGNKDNQNTDNSAAIYTDSNSIGTLTYTDCVFRDWVGGALNLTGDADHIVERCAFVGNGTAENFSHAITPNMQSDSTITVRDSLFKDSGGTDIDIGKAESGSYVRCDVDNCVFKNSRGAFKLNPQNIRTTVTNSYMTGDHSWTTMAAVKATSNDGNCGSLEMENCVVEGGRWPAVDLAGGGFDDAVFNNVAVQDVASEENRGGVGLYADQCNNVDIGTVSIHNVGSSNDGDAVEFSSSSGTASEIVYGGTSSPDSWNYDGVDIQSSTNGDPLEVTVPSESDVGPVESDSSNDDTSDDGDTSDTSELPNRLKVTGTGTETNFTFTISDEVAGAENSLEPWDEIDGSTVTGWVTETTDVDKFDFSGEVTEFAYLEGGPVDLVLNGESIDDEKIVGLPDNDSSDDETSGETQYGGYNQPEAGTSDWHVPLNENFEKIESDVLDIVERIEQLESQ